MDEDEGLASFCWPFMETDSSISLTSRLSPELP